MPKKEPPWMRYGLGDGVDKVHYITPPSSAKSIVRKQMFWACFWLLNYGFVIGTHRFYLGEKKQGAILLLFSVVFLNFLLVAALMMPEMAKHETIIFLTLKLIYAFIFIHELRAISDKLNFSLTQMASNYIKYMFKK